MKFGEKLLHALRVDRAVGFVWQASPGLTLANTAVILVQSLIPLLALYLMKLIVDGITDSLSAPDKTLAFQKVLFLIVLAGATALFSAIVQLIASLVQEAQSLKVTDFMQTILHKKSIEMDLAYYENSKYFDTLHRAQHEGAYRPLQIVKGIVELLRNSISLTAMVGLLFAFHWVMAIVLFLSALPGLIVKILFSRRLFSWQYKRTPDERKSRYYDWMLTGDSHAKEIRLFNLGQLFIKRFNKLRSMIRREKISLNQKRSTADFFAQTAATGAVFGSLAFIAYRTVYGQITLGDMVMYFGAFQRGLGFLKEFLSSLAGLYENNLFLANLYRFLDLEPVVKDPDCPKPIPKPMKEGIVFKDVSFCYPGTQRNVLKAVSFLIRPGEVVSLVGENGAGKTTLIKLLCRLYDPKEGSVFIDGQDLRGFAIADLRSQISVIFQDYTKYHLTAGENIWFGNIDQPEEHDKLVSSAQYTGADEVIGRLPHGYETLLGKWFDSGEEISQGEWQKIALARAFYRDAPIIVLDEPTSSLDVKTEHEVLKSFRQLVAGRTAILISHRFSTARIADRIMVLDSGRIIENGSHEELIREGGEYARLFKKQAAHYH